MQQAGRQGRNGFFVSCISLTYWLPHYRWTGIYVHKNRHYIVPPVVYCCHAHPKWSRCRLRDNVCGLLYGTGPVGIDHLYEAVLFP